MEEVSRMLLEFRHTQKFRAYSLSTRLCTCWLHRCCYGLEGKAVRKTKTCHRETNDFYALLQEQNPKDWRIEIDGQTYGCCWLNIRCLIDNPYKLSYPFQLHFSSNNCQKKKHFYTLLMIFYPMRGSANVDCQYHDRLDFISPARLFRTARFLFL